MINLVVSQKISKTQVGDSREKLVDLLIKNFQSFEKLVKEN